MNFKPVRKMSVALDLEGEHQAMPVLLLTREETDVLMRAPWEEAK